MSLSLSAQWRNAIRDSEVSSAARLIGWGLSTYMDRDGKAFPGKETLAQACDCDRRTVDRAVNELERVGLLRVDRSRGRRSNRYQALVLTPAQFRGSTAEEPTPTRAQMSSNPGTVPPESIRKRKTTPPNGVVVLKAGASLDGADSATREPKHADPRTTVVSEETLEEGGELREAPTSDALRQADAFLSHLVGSSLSITAQAEDGACGDCGDWGRRYKLGRLSLCRHCASLRRGVDGSHGNGNGGNVPAGQPAIPAHG